ncbi:MAG: DUF2079 domain-containing protein [Ardenticatenaceae bacterium]|nr:DUF2079 domain-containing protein [Ardenticatenaceae bacterium]
MSQAIWSATQGRPLVFTTAGIVWSRLSLHVELIYFLIAPLYALRPSPETLLILQAILYAVGAWPLFQFAARRLNHAGAALALTAVYLLYPVGQTAVLFHFHGDTLAIPFLLFMLNAQDKKAWRSYGIWLLLALSCKFYVAIPVATVGIILWWQGERKAGLLTFLVSAGWGCTAFFLIRPLFASPEAAQTGASIDYYLSYYFNQFFTLDTTLLIRLTNALIVFAPVLLVAIRAPMWLLPAASIVIPVMFSNSPGPSFDYRYHHYVLAVPFLMTAAIYGLSRLRQKAESVTPPQKWLNYAWLTLALTLLLNALLVNTPLNPFFYLASPGSRMGMDETSYGLTARDAFKDSWLVKNVPDARPVAASAQLGLHLVNRPVLFITHNKFQALADYLPKVDYVVVDALNDFVVCSSNEISEGGMAIDYDIISQLAGEPDFKLLHVEDGLLLFGREGEGLEINTAVDEAQPITESLTLFNDFIGLREAHAASLGNGRYRLTFTWQALKDLSHSPTLIAVSRIEGMPTARFVHLPSLAVHPTPTWQAGQIIEETFDIQLPASIPPGRFPLLTAWYDTTNCFAAKTDANGRVGVEVHTGWVDRP